MENFNTVPNKGTFGGSVEVINQNFSLAQQEMEVLQNKCENESARAIEAENSLRQLYNNLQQSQPIPVTSLPATGEAGKIYRLAGTTSYADYMYSENDLTTPIKMAEYDNAIDDIPTLGSNNLVKSGGVAKELGLTLVANGSVRNAANTDAVRTMFVPIVGMDAVKIETNRPNTPNSHYQFRFLIVSSLDLAYTFTQVQENNPAFVYVEEHNPETQFRGGIVDLTKYNNAKAIAFSIWEVDEETSSLVQIRKEDFDGYYIKILDASSELRDIESSGLSQLKNGSVGNPANANAVSTWFVSVENIKSIHFETNRPNRQNCRYTLGWFFLRTNEYDYSIVDRSITALDPDIVGPGVNYEAYSNNTALDVSKYEGVNSVACVITEYDYLNNTYIPLRYKDFKEYEVKIVKERYVNENVIKSSDAVRVRDGSAPNGGNDFAVATETVRIGTSKIAAVITNRPNKENCQYRYGYVITDNEIYIGTTTQVQSGYKKDYYYSNNSNIVQLTNHTDKIGIAFTIVEFNVATQTFERLRASDFDKYYVKIILSDTAESVLPYIINDNPIVKCVVRNGSAGNQGNPNAVATLLVPTGLFSDFTLYTTRPNPVGYHYEYTIDFNKSPYGDVADPVSDERSEHTDMQHSDSKFSRHFSESRGVQFGIWEKSNYDGSYHPLRVQDFDGYEVYIKRSGTFVGNGVIAYNQEKAKLLRAVCQHRGETNTPDKYFQLLIVTDTHDDHIATNRAIDALNGFSTVDMVIHCGDCMGSFMCLGVNYYNYWRNIVEKNMKPFYFVVGNHEAGNFSPVFATPTKADIYDNFIKPSVDAGHLLTGEYTENKCYYYHDIENYKKRLIVLDEYETPLILDDTDWIPIPYNSNLPTIQWNTSYTTGQEVNDFIYTVHSFRAAHNVRTASGINDEGSGLPRYKYANRARWISREQAQWFLNTLLSTPADYHVIVACHEPYSDNMHAIQTSKFTQKGIFTENFPNSHNYMVTDFIAEAINAFNKGLNFTINCVSKYPTDIPGYSVSANFTNKNTGTKVDAILGGHIHMDIVFKHNVFENQINITPICSNAYYPPQSAGADIRRESSYKSNCSDIDCFTTVTFRPNELALVKIGVDITEELEKRDYEIIKN